jgi:hypothetical protein
MWAQGLTIGVLIVAGALTHKNRQEAAANGMRRVSLMRLMYRLTLTIGIQSPTDHSWQNFVRDSSSNLHMTNELTISARGTTA